jgi:hypothetical protein
MTDDALPSVWISDRPVDKEMLIQATRAVLEQDRAACEKERRTRIACVLAVALLCPVLLWCAAYGKAPLVRAGYALTAAGTAVMVFAEWVYLGWSRQSLPGPADTRSHLQTTALRLSRQATLIRTAPVWSAPIFIGTAFIGVWLYQEVGHAVGYVLWAMIGTAWIMGSVTGIRKGTQLDERRSRMEHLLNSLE